jgi:hypothetical protein
VRSAREIISSSAFPLTDCPQAVVDLVALLLHRGQLTALGALDLTIDGVRPALVA